MDSRLLLISIFMYGTSVCLSWLRVRVYVAATLTIWPMIVLSSVGAVAAIVGLAWKGSANFNAIGILMIVATIFGGIGIFVLGGTGADSDHVQQVCWYSEMVPSDVYAQWACPQVQASSQLVWIQTISLLTPALLVFVAPFLSLRQINSRRS